jgi:hypothetical protein
MADTLPHDLAARGRPCCASEAKSTETKAPKQRPFGRAAKDVADRGEVT